MKKILVAFFALVAVVFSVVPGTAEAATRVGGHFRSNGTYVNYYYRSSANSYKFDNYSSYGNYNPYTGKKGYKSYWNY